MPLEDGGPRHAVQIKTPEGIRVVTAKPKTIQKRLLLVARQKTIQKVLLYLTELPCMDGSPDRSACPYRGSCSKLSLHPAAAASPALP